jgi:hypothetical protein
VKRIAWISIATSAFLLGCDGDTKSEQPHQTMREIFENIVVLLPASADPEDFADPDSRESIAKRLGLLAASAESLQRHTRSQEATFAQLSRMLTRDVEASRDYYMTGDYERAREKLLGSIWNCVECHSLQPSARRFEMAERLLERMEFEQARPHEQALFSVLTRRMPDALTIWEALFADPAVSASQLDAGGALRDYLAIALRVEREPGRAAGTLRRFAEREDLPPHLAKILPRWIDTLDALEAEVSAPASLERARALSRRADGLSVGPSDRSRLVLDLLNSSVLLELVQDDTRSAADRAEAYWILGEIESRGLGPFSSPKSELHLETAIREEPNGPFAERALDLLVRRTAEPYGGIDGPNLPDASRRQLQELRALIDAASAPRG